MDVLSIRGEVPIRYGDRIHQHSPYTSSVKTFVFKKSSRDGRNKITDIVELTEIEYPECEIDIISSDDTPHHDSDSSASVDTHSSGSDSEGSDDAREEACKDAHQETCNETCECICCTDDAGAPQWYLEQKEQERQALAEREDFSRFSYFPVEHPSLERFYQIQKSMFWVAQDIPYASDRADWERLDRPTKKYIKFIIFFFAQFDGIVIENLIEYFKKETSFLKDAKNFYTAQEFMEVIHNETYGNLIVTYITDEHKRAKAFNAIMHYPSIAKIADWVMRWMKSDAPLLERVVAFACLEGIFFSSAFASIYWIKRRNILKALCKANEFIARDEALHTEFAVELYKVLASSGKHTSLENSRIHEIISDSVDVIEEFTRSALRVDLIDMNADDMVEYIKCTADSLSTAFGSGKIYKAKNPFDWMAVLGLSNKSNFFETTVSEYGTQSVSDFTWDFSVKY